MRKSPHMTGERLREIRAKKLNLRPSQFARALGVGLFALTLCEAGVLPISKPVALASEALGDGWRPEHLRAPEAAPIGLVNNA